MPFRANGSPYWQYDIVIDGDRFRGSTKTKDFKEAKAFEARIRASAEKQKPAGGRYTLSEAFGTYHRDVMDGKPSFGTSKSQARAILAHIKGTTYLDKLTDEMIARYVMKDRATCSNATVNRRLQMLGRALRHMQTKRYKAKVADIDLKSFQTKESTERVRELTPDEQVRLFEHLPQEFHPFVAFALMTGFRIDNISTLQWSQVRLDLGEIFLNLKGGSIMTFPINAEMRALLSALPRSNVLQYRNTVFTRVHKKTLDRIPIGSDNERFGGPWRKALADAGIEDFRFHDLRHTYGTRMLRKTQNLKLVGKLMGHKTLDATMRYAHVLIEDMRDAMDDFSAFPATHPQNNPQNEKTK